MTYYTVRLGDNEEKLTEYEEFRRRMAIKDANRIDLEELESFMKRKIGREGAVNRHFKKENDAERVKQRTPDEYDPEAPDPKDYGLRLYCLRLTESVVVLFNGDRKWYSPVQKCENCEPYFTLANKISKSILAALDGGKIYVSGFEIFYNDADTDEGDELFEITI